MSILHKVVITHEYVKPGPSDFQREFTPYHINLLNALEDTSKRKVSQGQLTELSDRYWEFVYTNDSRREVKLTLRMTDENLSDKQETQTNFRAPARPRFK